MFKLFVDICVGVLLCTAQVEPVKPTVYLTAETYNECKITLYESTDGYTEVKPNNQSIQESLVVRQCDHFTTQEKK